MLDTRELEDKIEAEIEKLEKEICFDVSDEFTARGKISGLRLALSMVKGE